MSDVYVPEFLKTDVAKGEESDLEKLTTQYYEKFGHLFSTEDKIMTNAEITEAIKECIKSGIEMNDYLGLGEDVSPEDDI